MDNGTRTDMRDFDASVAHADGEAVVALSGELDLTAAATLREVMHPLFARYDADQVVLDVSALRFIDMGGVNALLSITRTFSSGRLRIVNAAPPVRRVLELAAVESAVVLDETW